MIPWRVKNYFSEHFPLLYHLIVNAGAKGNTPEYWDRRLADTWDHPARLWPTKNELLAKLLAPNARILDVGCGNGGILRYLKSRGFEDLHGLEISRYAVERLARDGIHMHYGALPEIPLPDQSYDVVIASQVLEHLIPRRRFASELRRVLRPRGSALIFVPDNCLGPIDEPEHVIKYDARSLRRFLTRHFEIESLENIRDVNHPAPVLFAHVRKSG